MCRVERENTYQENSEHGTPPKSFLTVDGRSTYASLGGSSEPHFVHGTVSFSLSVATVCFNPQVGHSRSSARFTAAAPAAKKWIMGILIPRSL
jgi:hypothetical protein